MGWGACCSKYKFMESHLVQQQKSLLQKIPDISNALDALTHLMASRDSVSAHFELADSVFANAKIVKENTVMLWLGANVMLEYSYDEAHALLTKNLTVRFTAISTRSSAATACRGHRAGMLTDESCACGSLCVPPCHAHRCFLVIPFLLPRAWC
jgi:hypothetical protein